MAARHGERHSIVHGRKTIDFHLLLSDRKTMEIAVYPDGTIVVRAPARADFSLIERKVVKRARWILRQLNYFRQFTPKTPARCYVNGETHLYLGRQYRLKSFHGSENSVRLRHGFFHVTCRQPPAPGTVKKLLDQWYLEKAKVQFAESMERCWKSFDGPGMTRPAISVRRMRKRWGSLSDQGTVTLNTELVKAPRECIDYVITHELCHLRHGNHGPGFYRLLESVLPDWEKIKLKLELRMM